MPRAPLAVAAVLLAAALPVLTAPVLTPPARADDYPSRKPGLWEMTMNMGSEKLPPQVVKFCIDAATDAKMREMGLSTANNMCSRHELHRSGDTLTIDAVCKMGPTAITSHTVMTMHGDDGYSSVINSHFDPPMMGKADSQMTQEAKWVGPCGPDMQPGDMMVHGQKMRMPTGGGAGQ
jgi:hypothetical protein